MCANWKMECSSVDVFISETFEQKLVHCLKSLHFSETITGQLPWNYLYKFIEFHMSDLYESDNMRLFCKYITELLLAYDCSDYFFVSKIIDIYCICNCEQFYNEPSLVFMMVPSHRLPFVLRGLKSHLSPTDKSTGNRLVNHHYVETLKALKKADVSFMRLLTKYGFSCSSLSRYNQDVQYEDSVNTIVKFM